MINFTAEFSFERNKSRISPSFRKTYQDIPWSDIIGMRTIFIHHNFGIDRDAVWRVVEDNLPVLKEQFSYQFQK